MKSESRFTTAPFDTGGRFNTHTSRESHTLNVHYISNECHKVPVFLSISVYIFHKSSMYSAFYKVIQKEKSIFWQEIVSVFAMKKVHTIMCLVLNGYRDAAVGIWLLNPLDF